MTNSTLGNIFGEIVRMTLFASLMFYASLVLNSYRKHGPQPLPRMKFRDNPLRSAEQLALWSGVWCLALASRVATPVFGLLSEASADVGDWYLNHRRARS